MFMPEHHRGQIFFSEMGRKFDRQGVNTITVYAW